MTLSQAHHDALLELANGPTTAADYGKKLGVSHKTVYHRFAALVGKGLASRAYIHARGTGHVEYVYRITTAGKHYLAGVPTAEKPSGTNPFEWRTFKQPFAGVVV